MRLSQLLLALTLSGAAHWASAQTASVELYNNTVVDLCVAGKTKGACTEVRPNQMQQVSLRAVQWINFGMEAYKFKIPQRVLKQKGRLQAEPDGGLYWIPSEASMPARPLPKQPKGFPLKPTQKVDLT